MDLQRIVKRILQKKPGAKRPVVVRGGGLLISRPRIVNIMDLQRIVKRFLQKK
jgi:hypothetical protein